MDLYTFISLLSIVGGCSIRSRILALPAGIGQVVDFNPDPTELADYMLVYRIRGAGIGTNVSYSLLAPATVGVYEIVDDDLPIALGGSRDAGLSLRFTNLGAAARSIEVDFARFKSGQLEDVRCLMGFPSAAGVALVQAQLRQLGITAD